MHAISLAQIQAQKVARGGFGAMAGRLASHGRAFEGITGANQGGGVRFVWSRNQAASSRAPLRAAAAAAVSSS
jgi:hypothetical protein